MHVHGCDEYVEKPCTPESILELVKRFVPPGDVALALAVGENTGSGSGSHGPERLGEVIPFPADRTSYTLTDVDEDTEREIMSKLDESFPDTPMFNIGERQWAPRSPPAMRTLVDFDLDEAVGSSLSEAAEPGTGSGAPSDPPPFDPAKRALQPSVPPWR
jgi:hypothetical protein